MATSIANVGVLLCNLGVAQQEHGQLEWAERSLTEALEVHRTLRRARSYGVTPVPPGDSRTLRAR